MNIETKIKIGNKNRKYGNADVEAKLKEKNYTLVEEFQYLDVKTKISYICNAHNQKGIQFTTLFELNKNRNCCTECISEEKSNRYRGHDLKEVRTMFQEKDLLLLSDTYLNTQQKLEYMCNKHIEKGVQTITLADFLNNDRICFYCAEDKRGLIFPFEYVTSLYLDKGLILEENQIYKNYTTKMRCRCIKHPEKILEISTQQLNGNKYLCGECKADDLEIQRLVNEQMVFNIMTSNGLIPTSNAKYYNDKTPVEYICTKHIGKIQYITYAKIRLGRSCALCGIEKNKGDTHYNWQGGKSELNIHLRGLLRPLVQDKLKEYNYICQISNINCQLEIHHYKNYSTIVNEVLKKLNLKIKSNISEYTLKEMNDIESLFLKKHEGDWGIPIKNSIHDLFHKTYGNSKNTRKQFEEFVKDFKDGNIKII